MRLPHTFPPSCPYHCHVHSEALKRLPNSHCLSLPPRRQQQSGCTGGGAYRFWIAVAPRFPDPRICRPHPLCRWSCPPHLGQVLPSMMMYHPPHCHCVCCQPPAPTPTHELTCHPVPPSLTPHPTHLPPPPPTLTSHPPPLTHHSLSPPQTHTAHTHHSLPPSMMMSPGSMNSSSLSMVESTGAPACTSMMTRLGAAQHSTARHENRQGRGERVLGVDVLLGGSLWGVAPAATPDLSSCWLHHPLHTQPTHTPWSCESGLQ